MLFWSLFLLFNFACEDQDGNEIEDSTEEMVSETRRAPYRYFEVSGVLKGIVLESVASENSPPPYQYSVTLLIGSFELMPPMDKTPPSLLVEEQPGVIRVAIDDRPTLKKSFIDAQKSLQPTGTSIDPLSSLKAEKWGKYNVGEPVSVGVIYTGQDRSSISYP